MIFSYCLEKAMAPHSSTLAWKIPWAEEPGRLQSMGSLTVGHDWGTSLSLFIFMHWRRKWQPTQVFLPEEFQGQGSLVGCRLWGSHRVRHDWSDLAAAAVLILNNRLCYYHFIAKENRFQNEDVTYQGHSTISGRVGIQSLPSTWSPVCLTFPLQQRRFHPQIMS